MHNMHMQSLLQLKPQSWMTIFPPGQRSAALPSAQGSAWGRSKQQPFPAHHSTSRLKSWCRSARKPVMGSTLHGSMCYMKRNMLLHKTVV